MPRYVCQSDTPMTSGQACTTWVESVSITDQLAITKQQSIDLTVAMCSPVIIVIAFLLFKRLAFSL